MILLSEVSLVSSGYTDIHSKQANSPFKLEDNRVQYGKSSSTLSIQ